MKKTTDRIYLTIDTVQSLTPGQVLHLGFDDFNRGKYAFEFIRCWQGDRNFRCEGSAIFDGESEPFVFEIYSSGNVMCQGSGSERLYFTKLPKGVKVTPAKVLTRAEMAAEILKGLPKF